MPLYFHGRGERACVDESKQGGSLVEVCQPCVDAVWVWCATAAVRGTRTRNNGVAILITGFTIDCTKVLISPKEGPLAKVKADADEVRERLKPSLSLTAAQRHGSAEANT